MGKKVTIASYDIDIKGIESKLSELRAQLNEDSLGGDFAKKLSKEISALETHLEKVKNAYPGAGATQKQIDAYNKKMENLRIAVSSFGKGAVDSFNDSDAYIKKNIKSVQEYTNKVVQAQKELDKITDDKNVHKFTPGTPGRKTAAKDVKQAMRTAATSGDRSGVMSAYAEYSKKQNEIMRQIAKEKGKDSDEYKVALADREGVHAQERDYIKMAEEAKKASDIVKQAKKEEAQAIEAARTSMNGAFQTTVTGAKKTEGAIRQSQAQISAWSQEAERAEEASRSFEAIEHKLKNLVSAGTILGFLSRTIRKTITEMLELDKQFNEIAIVSDYSTTEMWKSFETVNRTAQKFGVETKNVIEVQNLYYHQGKSMAEVNKLTAQTLTLAKITGMEYADATSKLTAVLNAYNIAAEDAVRVTDTIAAMDTNAAISSEELMTALTKTASIAANAGMSLESTEVFLTKMIETTREAPENLGTALKTIIARFGEVKQEVDGEMIELADINRVDTALKSVGISLLDSAGQIRDLDKVFMELSAQWDGLDRNTQRYIATIAAGSRQQSRFIAMMEDYDRTLELTNIAQDSAGLGARQLAKSQESLESSVNRLKSSVQALTSEWVKAGWIKSIVEGMNNLVNAFSILPQWIQPVVAGLAIYITKFKILDPLIRRHKIITEGLARGLKEEEIATNLVNAEKFKFKGILETLFPGLSQYIGLMSKLTKETNENTAATLANNAAHDKSDKSGKEKGGKGKGGKEKDGEKDEKGKKGKPKKVSAKKPLTKEDLEKIKQETDEFGPTLKALEAQWNEKKNVKPEDIDRDWKLEDVEKLQLEVGKRRLLDESDDNGLTQQALKRRISNFKEQGKDTSELKTMLKNRKKLDHKSLDFKWGELGKTGAKGAAKSLGTSIKAAVKGIIAPIKTAITSVIKVVTGAIGTAGAAIAAAVIAAIAVIFVAWKKGFKASLDDSKEIDKLAKAQEKYNTQLQKYNDLKKKSKKYKDFLDSSGKVKTNLTEEEKEEEQALAKELVEEYPRLLDYIDEEGNYHLKNAEAIEKELAAKEKMMKQASDTYTKTRLNAAKKGVYADTSTLAGQSMKNIQDYSATFGTEKLNRNKDLKEIAKAIDADGRNFNKSGFYDIVEAYAKGEKSSFDEKDMSDLFAGDIGQTNWKKVLEDVAKLSEQGIELNEDNLAKILSKSGAYGTLKEGEEITSTAKKVAESFMKLDEEFGGMYSSLLEGAALEEAEILIESAKMEINTIDFQGEVDSTLKDALAEAAVEQAKQNVGTSEAWWKLSTEEREQEVENVMATWGPAWEAATEDQIDAYNKLLNKENLGGQTIGKIDQLQRGFNLDAETTDEMTAAVTAYWNALPEEFKKENPEIGEAINAGSQAIIETLFQKISTYIKEDDKIVSNINKLFNDNSIVAPGFTIGLKKDQASAILDKTKNLDDSQTQAFLQTLVNEVNGYQETAIKTRDDFINSFIKQDFTNDLGIAKASEEFQKFGYTAEDSLQMAITAAGGLNNITLSSFEDTLEHTEKVIEEVSAGLEAMSALIEGSASLSQLTSYMTLMEEVWTESLGEKEALSKLQSLESSIIATGDGFKIASTDATEYGKEVVSSAQRALLALIAVNRAITNNVNRPMEERIEAAKKVAMLSATYAKLDAGRQKAHLEGIIEELEKAKEKAEEALEAIKNLVSWLREFDRFARLDKIIADIEKDYGHLEFEINFSTNEDVIEEDIKKSFANVNSQLAANQGGLAAAEDEASMWRDVISKRNSNYVSFDESGNAILNTSRLQYLQEQIAAADEESRPALQAEYDEIMANVDAYDKARDKVESYSTAVEQNMKTLEELMTMTYENITTVQEKLIEVRMEQEDKELEKVKEKYDAIKEADEEYLDHLKDIIDKERSIRDRKKQEEDVENKERKLAMMKMDTSGVYGREIQALEKELEQDYQDLEDDAVDKAVEEMEKEFEARAETMDKEVEYLENTLKYKREVMTEYNQWATALLQQGSDAVMAYLKANDKEYYTGTAEQQALWEQEWNSNVAKAVASNEVLKDSLIQSIFNTLDSCKENAGSFEQAVEQYSKTAVAQNGEVKGSVTEVSKSYAGLAEGVSGVTTALWKQQEAYAAAAKAATELKNAQEALKSITGQGPPDTDLEDDYDPTKDKNNGKKPYDPSKEFANEDAMKYAFGNVFLTVSESNNKNHVANVGNPTRYTYQNEQVTGYDGEIYLKFSYSDDDGTIDEVWLRKDMCNITSFGDSYWPLPGAQWYARYAEGGLADFTGPAWLDGTKTKPEMVLNPLQTKHFITLVDILGSLMSYRGQSAETLSSNHQEKNEIIYNLEVNVQKMTSDYDAEQMIKQIEEKLLKASRYRNVTTLTKKLQGI